MGGGASGRQKLLVKIIKANGLVDNDWGLYMYCTMHCTICCVHFALTIFYIVILELLNQSIIQSIQRLLLLLLLLSLLLLLLILLLLMLLLLFVAGSCNAYCVARVDQPAGQTFLTSVIRNTVNPLWDEQFIL